MSGTERLDGKASGVRNRKLNGNPSSPAGLRQAISAGVARPSSERPSVPNPDQHSLPHSVEPGRLRLILDRLQGEFYEVPPASERIAASVMAALKDLEESPPALPR
jgi:hypothetical protein